MFAFFMLQKLDRNKILEAVLKHTDPEGPASNPGLACLTRAALEMPATPLTAIMKLSCHSCNSGSRSGKSHRSVTEALWSKRVVSATSPRRHRHVWLRSPWSFALLQAESESHRITEGLRLEGTSGVIWSTPPLKQGHLEQAVQDHVQAVFEYLQGWRLHHLPGQPVPVLGHSHSEKVFPDVQREPPVFLRGNLLCFSLCPLPLVLSLGTTEKYLSLSSLHSPFRYLCTLIRSSLRLLQAEQSQLPQPFIMGEMLQSLNHLCGPLLDSLQHVHVCLVLRNPELDTELQAWPHQC